MRKVFLFSLFVLGSYLSLMAQTNPAITTWLQNTIGTGSYYVQGNSNTIDNNILYNCQEVCYSDDYVYISTKGMPAYPTGPFLDGNPSQAESQDAIFRFPLSPTQETAANTATTAGRIGVFINGVSIFDYRDGVAWNPTTNALCGGPGNPPCPAGPGATMDWNRDAVLAEMSGFDCSKGHPAMGNYHHHQNPSAFDLDQNVVSTICNLYDADGLYAIDDTQHSPLIGFAYDGFPIYGAYGYANTDGTGGIVRIKSSYQLKTTRGTSNVPSETTWPLGTFREDYEYIDHSSQSDYLDEHNGRFCVTPEYPNGIYCYFATVDANWNSAYPYVVGPTFYGTYADRLVSSINESCQVYAASVLPVKWNVFEALKIDNGVLLSWQTESEINNDYFTIERSDDGITFKDIAQIVGNGTTSERNSYSYLDEFGLVGIVYYRLRQTDYNDNEEYSHVVSVKNELNNNFKLNIFPNPVSEFITVQHIGLNKNGITIRLFDLYGRLLKTSYIESGSSIGYIDTMTLYNGKYILSVSDGQNSYSQKISIIH